jgi:hypothetical protein
MAIIVSATIADVTYDATGYLPGSVSVLVTGGIAPYSYAWSNGNTTPTAAGLAQGNYQLRVTDTVGASANLTYTVGERLGISTVISHCTAHDARNGEVTVTVYGSSSPYTYVWSNGGHTAHMARMAAGVYSVTVTSASGVTGTVPVTITQPAQERVLNANMLQIDGSLDMGDNAIMYFGARAVRMRFDSTVGAIVVEKLKQGVWVRKFTI